MVMSKDQCDFHSMMVPACAHWLLQPIANCAKPFVDFMGTNHPKPSFHDHFRPVYMCHSTSSVPAPFMVFLMIPDKHPNLIIQQKNVNTTAFLSLLKQVSPSNLEMLGVGEACS